MRASPAGVDGDVIRATVAGDEDPRRAEASAAEQHPAEARQIGGGAEEPGVPGDAAHPPRGRIVDDRRAGTARRAVARTAMPSGAQRSVGAIRGRSDGRQEHRVRHAQRLEDLRLGVAIEPLAAHAPDDVAEQEKLMSL